MWENEQREESVASESFSAFKLTEFYDVLVCYGIMQKLVLRSYNADSGAVKFIIYKIKFVTVIITVVYVMQLRLLKLCSK
jgi:hypothetical protein